MSHCIYTNYWFSIRNKNYVAFHVTLDNEQATLGCDCDYKTGQIRVNQIYQRRNKPVSEKMREFCTNWVNENKNVFVDYKNSPIESTETNSNQLERAQYHINQPMVLPAPFEQNYALAEL